MSNDWADLKALDIVDEYKESRGDLLHHVAAALREQGKLADDAIEEAKRQCARAEAAEKRTVELEAVIADNHASLLLEPVMVQNNELFAALRERDERLQVWQEERDRLLSELRERDALIAAWREIFEYLDEELSDWLGEAADDAAFAKKYALGATRIRLKMVKQALANDAGRIAAERVRILESLAKGHDGELFGGECSCPDHIALAAHDAKHGRQ